jgi:hypothetical protein
MHLRCGGGGVTEYRFWKTIVLFMMNVEVDVCADYSPPGAAGGVALRGAVRMLHCNIESCPG